MTRPRVLLVGPWPPTRGGVTTFMMNLSRDPVLAARYDFVAHTTSRPEKRGTTQNWGYAALFAGGPMRALLAIWVSLWHLVQFGPRVVVGRIAIVQVMASDFFVFWESALYILYARLLGRPTVLRLGGAFDRFLDASSPRARRWISWCVARADRVIVQSEYWRTVVARIGRVDGVVVVNNWVADGLPGDAARPEVAEPRFLFIAGNEATRKGVDTVLDAIGLLADAGVPARVEIVATPTPLAELIAVHPHRDRIDVLPSLPHEAVIGRLRAVDGFLLPSRGEGFPNSLVEAMACGAAVIATPVGAVPEIVRDGVDGLIVPVDDASALAAAMMRLATDRDARLAIGVAGLATVRARFTADAIRRRVGDLYEGLIAD